MESALSTFEAIFLAHNEYFNILPQKVPYFNVSLWLSVAHTLASKGSLCQSLAHSDSIWLTIAQSILDIYVALLLGAIVLIGMKYEL